MQGSTCSDMSGYPKKTITPAEARRAIYIDFEGFSDGRLVLLGYAYVQGEKRYDEDRLAVYQHVLSDTLDGAIDGYWRADLYEHKVDSRTPGQSVTAIVRHAAKQDRLIVSWSEHEMNRAMEIEELEDDIWDEFAERYRDGKATAKRWGKDRVSIDVCCSSPANWAGGNPGIERMPIDSTCCFWMRLAHQSWPS